MHPLLVTLVVACAYWIAHRLRWIDAARASRGTLKITAAIACVGLVAYPCLSIWYGTSPHFFDNAEPTMAAVGWLFHLGQPVYHSLNSADRYAHIYGPVVFIVQGYVLAALGPSLIVSKGVGVCAGLLGLLFLYTALRRNGSKASAVLTGLCALVLLCFRHYSFWNRPDSLEWLLESLGLWLATASLGPWSALILGVSCGLVWNLKLTGPLYSLPLLVLLHDRLGRRATIMTIVTAVVCTALPFIAFRNISLTNYLLWFSSSARTGLTFSLLRHNIEWTVFLSLPLLVANRDRAGGDTRTEVTWQHTRAAVLGAMFVVAIAASKPGAGPYHLIPFLAPIAYLVARHMPASLDAWGVEVTPPSLTAGFLAAALLISASESTYLVSTIRDRDKLHDVADVASFLDQHAGVIEMGYGSTEWKSFVRPLVVFRTGQYLVDQPAIREHQLEGIPLPAATTSALEHCAIRYWLIPTGEAPFSGVNAYPSVLDRPLYPPEFRQTFLDRYRQVSVTQYFDVWECR